MSRFLSIPDFGNTVPAVEQSARNDFEAHTSTCDAIPNGIAGLFSVELQSDSRYPEVGAGLFRIRPSTFAFPFLQAL